MSDEMTFNEQIIQIIEKEVPNQIGEKLKILLDESTHNKSKVIELHETISKFEKWIFKKDQEIEELKNTVTEWTEKEQRYVDLEKDKLQIEEKERNFEMKMMKQELDIVKTHQANYRNIIEIVFKSPVYKKEIYNSINREVQFKDENCSYQPLKQDLHDVENKIITESEE